MEKIFGWIKPNGDFIQCGMYDHISSLKDDKDVCELTSITDILDRLNSVYESCVECGEKYGHCEWHRYEMAKSDYFYRIIEQLYNANFIRVATCDDTIHFEMTKESVNKYFQRVKDFAENYGMEYKIEVFK